MKMGNLMPVERAMGSYQNNMKNYWETQTDYGPQVRKYLFFGLILP